MPKTGLFRPRYWAETKSSSSSLSILQLLLGSGLSFAAFSSCLNGFGPLDSGQRDLTVGPVLEFCIIRCSRMWEYPNCLWEIDTWR